MSLLGLIFLCAVSCASPDLLRPGSWRAWLDVPGGELAFGLDLIDDGEGWRAWLVNGDERIEVPGVSWNGRSLVLAMEHYDSTIVASVSDDGRRLDGEWSKRRGAEKWAEIPFHARWNDAPHSAPPTGDVSGRWAVDFADEEHTAVGLFEQGADGAVSGTFLTATGDYRFLAGRRDGDRLRLSCFDGAHAFLFTATLHDDGGLEGDFWSGDWWHDTWRGRRDDEVTLPDAYELASVTGPVELSELVFPDLDGRPRALDDPAFAGRARIIQVFGSWCPNCHDASKLMVELHERYAPRGLSIVGLAFELTGDFRRDAAQVRTYARRHGVEWPLLVAGLSSKSKATATLGILDRVVAYPTTIFLRGDGSVAAVHSGFAGPATGDAHVELRADFERIIEELLADDG